MGEKLNFRRENILHAKIFSREVISVARNIFIKAFIFAFSHLLIFIRVRGKGVDTLPSGPFRKNIIIL